MGCSPSNPNYPHNGEVADHHNLPRVGEPQPEQPPPPQVRSQAPPEPAPTQLKLDQPGSSFHEGSTSTAACGNTNTDGASSPSFATDSGRRHTVDFTSEMEEISGVVPEAHQANSQRIAANANPRGAHSLTAAAPPTDDAFSTNLETGPAYEFWNSRRGEGDSERRLGTLQDTLPPTLGIQTSQHWSPVLLDQVNPNLFSPVGEAGSTATAPSQPGAAQQQHQLLPPPPLAVSVGLGSGRADGAILAESTNAGALSRDSNDPEKSLFRVMIDPKLKTSSNSLLLPAGRSQDSGLVLDHFVPTPPMTSTTTQVGSAGGSLDSGGSNQSQNRRQLNFDILRLSAPSSSNGGPVVAAGSGTSLAGLPGSESTSTSHSSDSRKATRDEIDYFHLSSASRHSSSATPSSPSTDAASRDTSLLLPSSQ
jgi:hypothetical protein